MALDLGCANLQLDEIGVAYVVEVLCRFFIIFDVMAHQIQ
jgi:hypothetical protein